MSQPLKLANGNMDGRVKPGHDNQNYATSTFAALSGSSSPKQR
jgi:hypothetical protein